MQKVWKGIWHSEALMMSLFTDKTLPFTPTWTQTAPILLLTMSGLCHTLWMPPCGALHQFLLEPTPRKVFKIPANQNWIDTRHLGSQRAKQQFVNQHQDALPKTGYRRREYPPATKQQLAKWAKTNFEHPSQDASDDLTPAAHIYEPQEWHDAKSHVGVIGKLKYVRDTTLLMYFGPLLEGDTTHHPTKQEASSVIEVNPCMHTHTHTHTHTDTQL